MEFGFLWHQSRILTGEASKGSYHWFGPRDWTCEDHELEKSCDLSFRQVRIRTHRCTISLLSNPVWWLEKPGIHTMSFWSLRVYSSGPKRSNTCWSTDNPRRRWNTWGKIIFPATDLQTRIQIPFRVKKSRVNSLSQESTYNKIQTIALNCHSPSM